MHDAKQATALTTGRVWAHPLLVFLVEISVAFVLKNLKYGFSIQQTF